MNCCGCPFCILKGTEQIESVLSIEGFIWYNNMNYSVKEKKSMTVLKYLFAVLVTLPILFLGVFLMKRYSIELRKTNKNVERKAEANRKGNRK